MGAIGEVVRVLASPDDGAIYQVRLKPGDERYFVRGELRKLRDDEDESVR